MPGRTAHALIGAAAAGILAHMVLPKDNPDRGFLILSAVGVGALAGLAPDLIEPALSPNHRSYFHSAICAAAIAYIGKQAWDNFNSEDGAVNALAFMALAGAVGYGSHLGADALTPKSLPFLN